MNVCYLDNSVPSSFFNENVELCGPTRELWLLMEEGRCRFVASEVTMQEALRGPLYSRDFFMANFNDLDVLLPVTSEVECLAQHYIRAGVLTANHIDDARHVALCTLAGIEVLLSWNFHHVKRRDGFNEINRLHGHGPVRILTPHEYLKEIF